MPRFLGADALDIEGLVPGSLSSDQTDVSARQLELRAEPFDQRIVGTPLQRRRGDSDLQATAVLAAQGGAAGTWLQMHENEHAGGVLAQPRRGVGNGRARIGAPIRGLQLLLLNACDP